MLTSLLLSGRFWALALLLVSNAISYSSGHQRGYVSGKAEVQAEFDAYKAQSLEEAMAEQVKRNAKEAAMTASNQKVTDQYESLKTATSTAVRALDVDRLRLQATLAASRHSPGQDTGPGLPADGAAIVQSFSECVNEYSTLAGESDRTANQLKALQDYVRGVVKP